MAALSDDLADLIASVEDVDRDAGVLQERGRLLHEEIDTQINSATNRSMRALTVISTLLIPPTLVTGGLRHERAGRSLRALAERLRRGDRALWHGGRRALLLLLRRLGM